jgi:hypothetical protein
MVIKSDFPQFGGNRFFSQARKSPGDGKLYPMPENAGPAKSRNCRSRAAHAARRADQKG